MRWSLLEDDDGGGRAGMLKCRAAYCVLLRYIVLHAASHCEQLHVLGTCREVHHVSLRDGDERPWRVIWRYFQPQRQTF